MKRLKVANIYLVVGCNDYEPDDIIYVASTEEKAQAYIDKTFTQRENGGRTSFKDPRIYTTYDFVNIQERPVDE